MVETTLDRLRDKRQECIADIDTCEIELARAKLKLELLDEVIAEEEEIIKDEAEEAAIAEKATFVMS